MFCVFQCVEAVCCDTNFFLFDELLNGEGELKTLLFCFAFPFYNLEPKDFHVNISKDSKFFDPNMNSLCVHLFSPDLFPALILSYIKISFPECYRLNVKNNEPMNVSHVAFTHFYWCFLSQKPNKWFWWWFSLYTLWWCSSESVNHHRVWAVMKCFVCKTINS